MRIFPQLLFLFIMGFLAFSHDGGAAGLRMLRVLPQPKISGIPRLQTAHEIPSLASAPTLNKVPLAIELSTIRRALELSTLPAAPELLTFSQTPELWLFSGTQLVRQTAMRYAYAELLASGGIIAFPGDVPDDPLSTPFVIATREGNTEMLVKIFRRYHARNNPPPAEVSQEDSEAGGNF